MKICKTTILLILGLFLAISIFAQSRESFPGRGVQPAYETELISRQTEIKIGEPTVTLLIQYLSITFPEQPDYITAAEEWINSLLPQSGDLLGLQPESSATYSFKMQGYPVGRLLFYYLQEADPVSGQQKDRYAAFDLLHQKPLSFEACFSPEVWEKIRPFLLDPDMPPTSLDGNFSLMPDLMGEDVVVWLPGYAGKPVLKSSVLEDPQYSGRPYIRIPMDQIREAWRQDMHDFVEFRNGH